MSRQIQLVPELQQLFDDFVSVRQRFTDLAEAYVAQQLQLQKQQAELQNATRQLSAMRQKQIENESIVESYNQLKIDYELLHIATENHREESRAENKKRVHDLEEELKAVREKSTQQTESHETRVTQIVASYETKLRDADEKIRQLKKFEYNDAIEHFDYISSASIQRTITTPQRGSNKKWPKLAVAIESRPSTSRGRGRPRGSVSKRKLFKLDNEKPIDVD